MQSESSTPQTIATFLFTDVEGSTIAWETHPDQMRMAIALHDRIAAEVLGELEVRLIKERGEGDSLFIVARTPAAAISAAVELQKAFERQEWPDPIRIRVRMAIHCGEVEARDGDYYGRTPNRTARLRAIAHGGQILVSQQVASLISPNELGIRLRDMGIHRLKDLQEPVQVAQVVSSGLPSDFPALRSLAAVANNFPVQNTSFIGRTTELEQVKNLLSRFRIVTLVGAGGQGKTRVALQALADMLENFAEGAWLVDLTQCQDREGIESQLVQTLGVSLDSKDKSLAEVAKLIGSQRMVVLLDNCEHVVAEAADISNYLIETCTNLKIVATSREPLDVRAEAICRLESMPLPEQGRKVSEDALKSEAIQLFLDRARQVRPDFSIRPDEFDAVCSIISQTDGIPLAIEIAAAKLKSMGIRTVSKLLADRFRTLVSDRRGVEPRQQTLEALIEWSYELLSPRESELFRRLSVMAGSWDLDAPQEVCSSNQLSDFEIVELHSELVEKSLVVYDSTGETDRYRFLSSIRDFAISRIADDEELQHELRTKHAQYYAKLCAKVSEGFEVSPDKVHLDRLSVDFGNFQAAFEHSKRYDTPIAIWLAISLWTLFANRGRFADYLAWVQPLTDSIPEQGPNEAYKIWNALGNCHHRLANLQDATLCFREALKVADHIDQDDFRSITMNNLANVASDAGQLSEAQELYLRALDLNVKLGQDRRAGANLVNLGTLCLRQQNITEAEAYYRRAIDHIAVFGHRVLMLAAVHGLGNALLAQDRPKEAVASFREALSTASELEIRPWITVSLDGISFALGALGRHETAARLFGCACTLRKELGMSLSQADITANAHHLDLIQSSLGAEFTRIDQEGREMELADALLLVQNEEL